MAVRFGHDLYYGIAAGKERKHDGLAVGAYLCADMRSRLKLLQHAQLRQARCVRRLDAEALDEREQGVAALIELFAEIGLRRGCGVGPDLERLDDRTPRRLNALFGVRRNGRKRHYSRCGEERDCGGAAEPRERSHESARIP
jgi:hypothetical protein